MNKNYPVSDHFNGETFFNPWGANISKSLFEVMKWKATTTAATWPESVEVKEKARLLSNEQIDNLHVTYIGHATTYIQDKKMSVLTDPQFSDRASPMSFAGPKRVIKPAVNIEELPSLHFVLVSHNHYDHLDLPSLKKLNEKFHPTFIVPLGNGKLLKSEGIENVIELDWWQSYQNFTLVPVQHWSARGVFDRNHALWGGFVIQSENKKIFFAGDTGYGPHFKMIKEKLGAMDLSLLPIGAYEPRWFMKDQHMNPEDAVLAHLDLASKQSIAIHFETFQLTDEAYLAPRETLAQELKNHHLKPEVFLVPQIGETIK